MINIKDLYGVLKEAGKIEEYQKILDLIDDSLRLREEIEQVKKENSILKEKITIQEDLDFKRVAYYKKSNGDGPYCQACWDRDKKLIRILSINEHHNFYNCNVCKNTVNLTGSYDPPIRIVPHHENYM
ncbi:MAG: Uncharacterized protein CEN87_519 [Parcubacteria group bacterium Licking1014_1]|nr:MAG: Uncharacterized protein CEN87_519 [Parcubacteria group bacterium Licking1014_1]